MIIFYDSQINRIQNAPEVIMQMLSEYSRQLSCYENFSWKHF
jgi:hypothetical protein